MNQFPIPPIDLASLPAWLVSAPTLAALMFLFWQLDFMKALTDYAKGVASFAFLSVLALMTTFVGARLTADVIAQLQPYYADLVLVLGVVVAGFGVRVAFHETRAWYQHRLKLRFLAEKEVTARIEYYLSAPKEAAPMKAGSKEVG